MRSESTRQEKNRSRKAVTALVLSVLLITSVITPALATGAERSPDYQTTVNARDVSYSAAASELQQTGSVAHSKTESDAQVAALSNESQRRNESRSAPRNATTTDVTLITGQTVTVVETGDETRYLVGGETAMHRVATQNTTYIFPKDVDFDKFAPHFFDINFLLQQNLTNAETDSIPVIVSEDEKDNFVVAGDGQESGTELDSVSGVDSMATLESIGAQAARVEKSDATRAYEQLAADDSIGEVTLDIKYRADLATAGEAVSAPSARNQYGVSGNNVKIAVLDTGIDNSHPALQDNVVDERDFSDGSPNTVPDPYGHGTHVAGIIASENETYTGMAPNASLLDYRVLGDDGSGYTSDIVEAMEYAWQNDADIISMSIGGPVGHERSNDRYTEAVNNAVENGTLVVTSAGNDGPGQQTVNTPGIQSKALTVGATDGSGEMARFSSRGPTPVGHHLKPNVVAPGVNVKSTISSDAGYDPKFVEYSGTSMSTPAVSGVAALLIEKRGWSPQRVKAVLTSTADPLAGEDAYTQGAGLVDATDAVGTEVVVSPGTVDFGTYTSNTTATRTVSVSAISAADSSATLDVTNATATNLVTGEAIDVLTNESSITIEPGTTEQVEISIDTDVPYGIYSGRISFDGGEYTAVFGFVRAREVTVDKQGIDGTSTENDSMWLFAEETGPYKTVSQQGIEQFDGSPITYEVINGGEYNFITHGINEENGQPVVVSREMSLTSNHEITLRESNTTTYQLDTSEIEGGDKPLSTRSVQVTFLEDTSHSRYIGALSGLNPSTSTVRFNAGGELAAAVEHLLVPQSAVGATDNFSAEAIYHLAHRLGETSGTEFRVDRDSLNKKQTTYRRSNRDRSYNVTFSASTDFPYDWYFDHSVTDGIGDRRHQTVYLNEHIDNHGIGATSEESATNPWDLSTIYNGNFGTGYTYSETVNRHPYTGHVNLFGQDSDLAYYTVPQRGQGGRPFADDQNDTLRLYLNGTKAHDRTDNDGHFYDSIDESLNPGTEINVTTVGRNGAMPLSTRTVTKQNVTYVPGGDYEAPKVESVNVLGQTANSTVADTVRVRFRVEDDSTDLAAYAANDAESTPFDGDGRRWKSMSVEKVSDGWDDVYEAELDVNEAFGQYTGRLSLAVEATDDDGNSIEVTTFDAFRVDAERPTVDLAATGTSETPTEVNGTIRTNKTLTVNVSTSDAWSQTRTTGTFLSANFTNFRTWGAANRTESGTWTTTMDLSDLPDDGNYSLGTVAADEFWNVNVTKPGVTVVLDRDAPDLGATIEKAGNDGRVTLTSDESLQTGNPDSVSVTVEKPGNTEEVSLTRNESAGEYVWDGAFDLGEDGTYNVTATGADRTGNVGETASTTEIETVNVTEREVTVVLEKSGLFIEFRTDEAGFNSTVSVTESRSALAPLSKNLAGLNFLNGELGKNLTNHLDNATIGIPVNKSNLPPGVADEQVDIGYYNPDSKSWDLLDTTVEERTIDGETRTYWVTNVDHFSTYGAVADDQQAPTLDAKSPSGTTLDYGTTQQTVTFNYSDDISGVDASAVELEFDGERVTEESETNVTGEYARYDVTGLSGGEHTAKVTVVDEAGNEKTYTTSFTIDTDSIAPTVVSSDPGDGAELDSDTGSVDATIDFSDDLSGVNVDALRVEFDGSDVTDDATVLYDADSTSGQIEYTVDSLSAGSSHTLGVYLEDSDGNGEWYEIDFSVGESESSGGGGGGGGAVPPPAVQEAVVELTGTYAEAKITSARSGNPGEVTFEGGLDGGEATFRGLTVEPSTDDAQPRFFVEAESSEAAPSGVAAFEGADQTLGYLTVTPTYIGDSTLETVGVTFGVDAAKTDTPKNVALYQYANGEWSEVETEFREERGGSYRFYAPADSTGTFAVGLDTASFEVTDATLDATEVAPGDSVTVTATVEFDRTLDAGDHEVAISSARVGTVSASEGESGMGDERNQQTKGGSSGSGIPGFGLPATLVALVGALLFARRRE